MDTKKPNIPFKPGHFYSPEIDWEDVVERQRTIWNDAPSPLAVDFGAQGHERLLREVFPRYARDFDYPETGVGDGRYFLKNGQFNKWDGQILFTLLRHLQPSRLVEVGSGFSSCLMADVNRRFLNFKTHITCIEPYPRAFLKNGIEGISRLIVERVQNVPLDMFEALRPGDILFIDSSHVAKTGSDVNHLFFEVLPRLKIGVYVHFHDIFLPEEYKKEWVIGERRSWSEQYLLRAFLMYNQSFEVVFGANYALTKWPALVAAVQKSPLAGGGSFWLRRIA